jgi:tRNA 2-thiouridine synthesizing protein A
MAELAPPSPAATLDVGHEGCGTLLVVLRKRVEELEPGQVLEVVGYDPGAKEDLPAWCRMTGNPLLAMRGDLAHGEPIHYFIQRGR